MAESEVSVDSEEVCVVSEADSDQETSEQEAPVVYEAALEQEASEQEPIPVTFETDLEEEASIPEILLLDATIGPGKKYWQILVNSELEDGQPQVTFDDNNDNNYWCYHQGKNYPHVSEIFLLESEGNSIRIVGYLPPPSIKYGQMKWYLTVREDKHGILERFPKFRPKSERDNGDKHFHEMFEFKADETGKFALSFKTIYRSCTVYLVPNSDRKRMAWKETNTPVYAYLFRGV